VTDNQDKVAAKLGLEKTEAGVSLTKQSLLAAIGGPLGIAEAILPAFTFSIVFAISHSAVASVTAAAAFALGFIAWRAFKRQSVTQALVGAAAIAFAAFLALRDGGSAQDYFVPGFITNAAYGSVMLISVLFRYPIMGLVVQFLFGKPNWRIHRRTFKRVRLVTLIWVAFFGLRLAVQLPLYFSEQVELLAASRVIMGAPAYAGLLALTWVLLRSIAEGEKE
jgi:hypothetical protein